MAHSQGGEHMKKLLYISGILILIDQATKHVARHLFLDSYLNLIYGILTIYPIQNTNLGWLGGFHGHQTPFALNVATQLVYGFVMVVVYKYLCFLTDKNRILLNLFFPLMIAGVTGAFIDVVFFRGSWDFIKAFQIVIFDVKDIYLLVSAVLIVTFNIAYIPQLRKLTTEQRNQLDFVKWLVKYMSSLIKN